MIADTISTMIGIGFLAWIIWAVKNAKDMPEWFEDFEDKWPEDNKE